MVHFKNKYFKDKDHNLDSFVSFGKVYLKIMKHQSYDLYTKNTRQDRLF